MPLEATMMIVDTSEYMRNGDYQPTRFDAQADAVNVVFQTKIDSNPESTVGIMSMAGKGPEVLVTHTKDLGHILSAVHTASRKIGGSIDIPTAVAVAQLALKHRENKTLRQRIIVFVGSPLEGQSGDEKAMVKLGKKLKKNNVAVDVVAFGDGIEEPVGEEGKTVLKAFVDSVNNGDNSHLVIVQPGSRLLSDVLISSPILASDRSGAIPAELGGTGPGASSGGAEANEFGLDFDPNLDPELAMALRLSMQEAQAREEAERAASGGESSATAAAGASSSAPPAPATSTTTTTTTTAPTSTQAKTAALTEPADAVDDEEAALLQQALAMSEGKDVEMAAADGAGEDEEDEEAAIARAIEMSMQDNNQQEKDGNSKGK
ncbi:hypothetical protein AX16_003225 [Volvariella volvacea WC 439]|nr:hypothetical protein AX16_003225 [Volvariella volvacea WC 439]